MEEIMLRFYLAMWFIIPVVILFVASKVIKAVKTGFVDNWESRLDKAEERYQALPEAEKAKHDQRMSTHIKYGGAAFGVLGTALFALVHPSLWIVPASSFLRWSIRVWRGSNELIRDAKERERRTSKP